MIPQGSLLNRLVWQALRARAALWAMGVQASPVADGACGPVLGMVAGMALRPHQSDSAVVVYVYGLLPVAHGSWREAWL